VEEWAILIGDFMGDFVDRPLFYARKQEKFYLNFCNLNKKVVL